MEDRAAARPAPHRGTRGRHSSVPDADDLTVAVRWKGAVFGDQHPPPTFGRRSGNGDVATQADQHAPTLHRRVGRVCRQVGREGFPGRAEIELHARGEEHALRGAIDMDHLPARHPEGAQADRAAIFGNP